MDNFPANSHNASNGPKEVAKPVGQEAIEGPSEEKVITGQVVTRKKPLTKRLADTFFGGTAKDAAKYVLHDVLLPAAQDAITDGVSQLVERLIFGEGRGAGKRTISRPTSQNKSGYVSYNQYAATPAAARRPDQNRNLSRKARSNHDLDEIILETMREGQAVIERMFDYIQRYDTCSVANLYNMVGITPKFTDEQWGWTDISDAHVVRDHRSGGYVLDLPKPEYLN